MFEFANLENEFGDATKNHKKIFTCGIMAVILCIVTGLPKLILLFSEQTTTLKADVSASLLMLSQAIFILSYLIGIFYKKADAATKPTSKHSA